MCCIVARTTDFRYRGSIKDAVFLKHQRQKQKQKEKQKYSSKVRRLVGDQHLQWETYNTNQAVPFELMNN